MSYTRPAYNSADASWVSASGYTRPDFDAVDASFQQAVIVLVGTAHETNTARAIRPDPVIVQVGTAAESGAAQAITGVYIIPVGTASELNTAGEIQSNVVVVDVFTATETDAAQPISPVKVAHVGTATEADAAQAIAAVYIIPVGTAQEINTASEIGIPVFSVVGTAYEVGFAQVVLPNPPQPVSARHIAPYTMPVQGRHVAPWRHAFAARHVAPYDLLAPVSARHIAPFGLEQYNTVEGAADLHAGFCVEGAADLHAGFLSPVSARHVAPFAIEQYNTVEGVVDLHAGYCVEGAADLHAGFLSPVSARHIAPYELLQYSAVEGATELHAGFCVEGAIDIVYHLQAVVEGATDLHAPLRETVEGAIEIAAGLNAYHTAEGATTFIYSLLGGSPSITTGEVVMMHGGQKVDITGAVSIEINEGESYWRAGVDIANTADASLLQHGAAVTLDWYGEEFALVVAGMTVDRRLGVLRRSLKLVSPSALLEGPPAPRMTKTWDAPTSAKAIVEELVGAVDWRIMDWIIPANRLGADNAYPMAIARRVVEAIGAVIECNPDGTLYVRYLHETPINQYPTATPAHTFNDHDSLFALSDQNEYADIADQFRIMDIDGASFADRLEFVAVEDSGLAGKIHVYPSPWRPVRLVHTGTAAITLTGGDDDILEKVEQIEIVEGKGSLNYPINTITSVVWQAVNLGGLGFEPGSNAVVSSITGETLCTVTYTTKAKIYDTSAPMENDVQYVLYED